MNLSRLIGAPAPMAGFARLSWARGGLACVSVALLSCAGEAFPRETPVETWTASRHSSHLETALISRSVLGTRSVMSVVIRQRVALPVGLAGGGTLLLAVP